LSRNLSGFPLSHGKIAAILCALALPVLAFSDLFTGTWKVDAAKSRVHAAGSSNQILHIETTAENFDMTRSNEGSPPDLTVHARFGGDVFGVINSNEVDAVKCWRNDARTISAQFFKSGSTAEWVTLEASKDGKSLKWTTSITDAKGKESKSSLVFEKQ
jgi:hypothetical protein